MDSIFSAEQSGLVDTVKRSWPQPLIIDDELDGLVDHRLAGRDLSHRILERLDRLDR